MAGSGALQSRRECEDYHRQRGAEPASLREDLADGGRSGRGCRREAAHLLEGAGVHSELGGAVEMRCGAGEGGGRHSAAQARGEAGARERGALAGAREAADLRRRARDAESGASRCAHRSADLDDRCAAGGGERESAQRGEDHREVAAKPAE